MEAYESHKNPWVKAHRFLLLSSAEIGGAYAVQFYASFPSMTKLSYFYTRPLGLQLLFQFRIGRVPLLKKEEHQM